MNHRYYQLGYLILLLPFLFYACSANKTTSGQQKAAPYWEASTPAAENIDPSVINSIHQDS